MNKFIFAFTLIAGLNAMAAEVICTTTLKTGQEASEVEMKLVKTDIRKIALDQKGNVPDFNQSIAYIVDAMDQGGGSFNYVLGVKNGRIVAATLTDEVNHSSASIDALKNQTRVKLSTFSRDSEDKTISAVLDCSVK